MTRCMLYQKRIGALCIYISSKAFALEDKENFDLIGK